MYQGCVHMCKSVCVYAHHYEDEESLKDGERKTKDRYLWAVIHICVCVIM